MKYNNGLFFKNQPGIAVKSRLSFVTIAFYTALPVFLNGGLVHAALPPLPQSAFSLSTTSFSGTGQTFTVDEDVNDLTNTAITVTGAGNTLYINPNSSGTPL